MTERTIKKKFDPSKYGMIFCPKCMGAGRIVYQDKSVSVCSGCEGFGLIKKEEKNVSDQKGVNEVHISDLDESGE